MNAFTMMAFNSLYARLVTPSRLTKLHHQRIVSRRALFFSYSFCSTMQCFHSRTYTRVLSLGPIAVPNHWSKARCSRHGRSCTLQSFRRRRPNPQEMQSMFWDSRWRSDMSTVGLQSPHKHIHSQWVGFGACLYIYIYVCDFIWESNRTWKGRGLNGSKIREVR
jgi:hypothetical protein